MTFAPHNDHLFSLGPGPRDGEGSADMVELELSEGRRVLVGSRAEWVERCFWQCMSRYYADFAGAGEERRLAFKKEVLAAMNDFYTFTANGECLAEVARLMDNVTAAAALGEKNRAKLERMGSAPKHERREPVDFLRLLDHCFEVAEGHDKERVRAVLADICRDMVRRFGLDPATWGAVSEVLCGDRRDVVLKSDGNAEVVKIAVAVLVHEVVEERRVCRPVPRLTTWGAAAQAFLKKAGQPYAEGNFSKAHRKQEPGSQLQALMAQHLRKLEGEGQGSAR